MFFGAMSKESANQGFDNLTSEIKIPDITPIAFDFLIKYIYGLNPNINNNNKYKLDNITDILYLSKKYLIKSIENECIKILQTYFNEMKSIDQIFNCLNRLYSLGLNVCDTLLLLDKTDITHFVFICRLPGTGVCLV